MEYAIGWHIVLRAYSHQRRAFLSAAEILQRIYQNPIHLNGARWRTTFFRRRTSRCLQKLVRQRFPFKCMGCEVYGLIHTKDARFVCYGNSAADISKSHTFKWDPLTDEVCDAAWSSPTGKTWNAAAKLHAWLDPSPTGKTWNAAAKLHAWLDPWATANEELVSNIGYQHVITYWPITTLVFMWRPAFFCL